MGAHSKVSFFGLLNIVNTMIQQLSVFTAEVTRVAREVGTDGKNSPVAVRRCPGLPEPGKILRTR